MSLDINTGDAMPVVRDPRDFDRRSGNVLERLVFNFRVPFLVLCALATLLLGAVAIDRLALRPGFEKMLPQSHPYIRNFLENRDQLGGMGNAVRVVVANPKGDVFESGYLDTLRAINDELVLMPGVDRAWVKSLWTPAVRWTEVTEEGFAGGPVMPDDYDGSPQATEQLRANIARSAAAQSLVATHQRSSMIFVPLLDRDPATGARLDYRALNAALEDLRSRHQANAAVEIHVIGFAKMVGELIDGLLQVLRYFAIAALVTLAVIYAYTRCLRSTLLAVGCSVVAVIWQLGLVAALGFELDPYSMLVPFLVFAIGVSHGAQKMNGIMRDVGRGTHRYVAARYTFRRLFLAGLTALLSDAVGFVVLAIIDIPVIQDLAVTASLGVAVLVFTNLLLLPVLLSYVGVSPVAARRSLSDETQQAGHRSGWSVLDRFTERRWATGALVVAALLAIGGYAASLRLQIGDLDPGAPELSADSVYNRDNAFVTANYRLSSDVFAVIVKTPPEGCLKYETLQEADALAWRLRQVPGVQTSLSLVDAVRQITAGSYEGSSKWLTVSRNQDTLNYAAQQASVNNPDLFNTECSVMPVVAYLADHKAATLDRVSREAEAFAATHGNDERRFLLAAGNAGIEAATNSVVREANHKMLLWVYGAVIVFCFLTFRSWRAVVVAILPLMLTSILCEALMVGLGIGVKVATLPVIALGVGIGVDYALYLLSVQLARQREGVPLAQAYREAMAFTGKVVALVGVTLAAGVVTWAFSPIKFQADMGILLTYMFVWNMVGAILLIPALSHFLLNPKPAPAPATPSSAGAIA
jgi:predicted RND superfamily exporter protein